jgi:DNA protecting protein DprA
LLDAGKIALEKLENRGIHFLTANHECFPENLKNIQNPPYWLFVEGDPYLLSRKSLVAIVGTRHPSYSGVSLTKELAKELVCLGYTVVSGLAEGIDTAAHETVVEYGGKTIAVLGNGLNIDFPASNRELRRSIITHGGTIVTDHFPDTMYSAANFVNRNRIIAGLSNVVIPIESKAKSGTAHTIKFAEESKKKLIGVIKSDNYDKSVNEIPDLLREKGYPIIDLNKPTAFHDIRAMLEEFGHDTQPRRADSKGRQEACYAEVIQAFNKAFDKCPLKEKDFDWLINVLRSEVEKRKNAH